MRETGQGRVVVEPAHLPHAGRVGDVEDDDATIDVGDVGAVGPPGYTLMLCERIPRRNLVPHRRR